MRRLSCLALVVALSGCASSASSPGDAPPSSSPPSSSPSSPAGTAVAEGIWDHVGDTVITEESAVFSQVARMTRADGYVDTVTDGEYDLRGMHWKSRLHYESTSPTFRRKRQDVLGQRI